MYKRSIEDPAGFWSDIASQFYWKQKWGDHVYSENLDFRKGPVKIEVGKRSCCFFFFFLPNPNPTLALSQWFKDGITNISYNCLDRNVEAGLGDKIALFWEGNDLGFDASLTYSQLLHRVCQVTLPSPPCILLLLSSPFLLFLFLFFFFFKLLFSLQTI